MPKPVTPRIMIIEDTTTGGAMVFENLFQGQAVRISPSATPRVIVDQAVR